MSVKRTAYASALLAVMIIVSIIENALPPVLPPLPYAKLGIANAVLIIAVYLVGAADSAIIATLRVLTVAIFSGNISSLLFSLPAAAVSLAVMLFALRFLRMSVVCVSILSALMHNVTQIAVASLITGTPGVFIYLPYLGLFGCVAGAIVGIISYFVIRTMPERYVIAGEGKKKNNKHN